MKILAKPIEIIAVFYTDKNPVPYKFKVMDESGELVTIKVDQVITSRKDRMAGVDSIIYECQSEIRGVLKRYELKYLIAQCRWQLYKM